MKTRAGLREASGVVAPGFERIAEVFTERLATKRGGATLSIHVAGRSVANLWGGSRRSTEGADDWPENTLVNLFSVSKTLTALCILRLVDQGRIALDDPVCSYWPEFAANGKAEITIRQVLSHTAGLPGISQSLESLDIFDGRRICECLENESPWWPPGTKRGVHVQFYGHLLGEVVRRVAGVSIGTFWRKEIASALDADVFLGVPEHEHSRIAEVIEFSPAEKNAYLSDPTTMLYRVMTNPPAAFNPQLLNSPLCWKEETCGYGTAEAVARVFDLFALVNSGHRGILSTEILREALRVQTEGWDEVLAKPKRWCFGLQAFGTSGWIGMGGLGGALGIVNPEAAISLVFLANAMGDWRDSLVLLNVLSQMLGTAPL
jgi:CubicO group peptidase (beta-lactamase class C family)